MAAAPLPPATVLRPGAPGFPPAALELPDPPLQLRVVGCLPPLGRAVAIVGTRHADDEGRELAHGLAMDLASAGCIVVSGGARGIDRAAHEGALAAGAPTVAVLATGFAPPYPKRHAELFARIVEGGGALVAEVEDGTAPHPGRFLQRNRLVAALGRAVVVVQAPLRSGALSTAAHAERLHRPILGVPAAPSDPRGRGCLELLRRGATVCTRARDVLSVPAFGGSEPDAKSPQATENLEKIPDLDPDGQAVWQALGRRARHVDEVARRVGLPVGLVQRALVGLMLMGLVEERGPGRYARALSRIHPSRP